MKNGSLIILSLILSLSLVVTLQCKRPGERLAEKLLEKQIERGTGGKATVDLGSGVDLSGLPDAFRYPGARGVSRVQYAEDKEKGSGAMYVMFSPDPRDRVAAHYRQALSGWKQILAMDMTDGTQLVYQSGSEKQHISVTLTTEKDKGGGTNIAVIYHSK